MRRLFPSAAIQPTGRTFLDGTFEIHYSKDWDEIVRNAYCETIRTARDIINAQPVPPSRGRVMWLNGRVYNG